MLEMKFLGLLEGMPGATEQGFTQGRTHQLKAERDTVRGETAGQRQGGIAVVVPNRLTLSMKLNASLGSGTPRTRVSRLPASYEDRAMYCIHCGEQVVASANFCGACGTKVIRQDEGGQRSDPTVPVLRALEDSEASTDPRDHDPFEDRPVEDQSAEFDVGTISVVLSSTTAGSVASYASRHNQNLTDAVDALLVIGLNRIGASSAGGYKRWAGVSAEARSRAARHAVNARWEKQRQGADKGRT